MNFQQIASILAFLDKGFPVTKEKYAIASEIHAAIGEVIEQASPYDNDSPSVISIREIADVAFNRIGKKLLDN